MKFITIEFNAAYFQWMKLNGHLNAE
jgi:hypothetical protein